jgi:hypothetical protein
VPPYVFIFMTKIRFLGQISIFWLKTFFNFDPCLHLFGIFPHCGRGKYNNFLQSYLEFSSVDNPLFMDREGHKRQVQGHKRLLITFDWLKNPSSHTHSQPFSLVIPSPILEGGGGTKVIREKACLEWKCIRSEILPYNLTFKDFCMSYSGNFAGSSITFSV